MKPEKSPRTAKLWNDLWDMHDKRGKTFHEMIHAVKDHAAELEEELDKWKQNFTAFAVIHAADYGRQHYGDGCLHFTHYDLLKEAGARMDDFRRCGSD